MKQPTTTLLKNGMEGYIIMVAVCLITIHRCVVLIDDSTVLLQYSIGFDY